MVTFDRAPDVTYTAEDGRRVEIYGQPTQEMFVRVMKRIIDSELKKAAVKKVKEEQE